MLNLYDYVASFFIYDAESGKVIAKDRDFGPNLSPRNKQWKTRFANKAVGYLHHGYVRVRLPDGKELYAHQIAFLLKEGFIPEQVDHIDLNKSNNVWTNLRQSTASQNAANCAQRYNNKAKLKGVSYSKSNGCWRMDIQFKKVKYYEYHLTEQAAYEAYCRKSAELHKEFGRV